jgi:hypothetical protein
MAAYNIEQIIIKTLEQKGNREIYDNGAVSAKYGVQEYFPIERATGLLSGAMTGCYLIIGIEPDQPQRQFMLHGNLAGAEKNYIDDLKRLKDKYNNPCFYLFFTHKSYAEVSMENSDMVPFIENLQQIYGITFSTVFYVDDLQQGRQMDRVEVGYFPQTGKLTVYGIEETQAGNCNYRHDFSTSLPGSISELQTTIKNLFQNEGLTLFSRKLPEGVEKLCRATSISAMKEIATTYLQQSSRFRSKNTESLYTIIAKSDEHSTVTSMLQAIQNMQSPIEEEREDNACRLM